MTKEEEFLAKLLETFREEAEEHLKALSDGLLALEGNLPPEQSKEMIINIFREAHSLKGAARSVNQQTVQEICQSLENVLSQLKEDKLQTSPSLFDVLHKTIDTIKQALFSTADRTKIDELIEKLNGISSKEPESSSPPTSEEIKPVKEESVPLPVKAKAESTHVSEETEPASSVSKPLRKETVRVSMRILNQLFQEIEEMLMVKLYSHQQVTQQRELSDILRHQEKELANFNSEMQVLRQIPSHEISFDKFSELIQKMLHFLELQQSELKLIKDNLKRSIKSAEQNSHFVSSLVDTLLEDMKKVLMQPMSSLYESLPLMVREISRQLKKEINLEFHGGNIEIDRRVLEEIKDPIIHIIRNAVDHGIESPEERKATNKPPAGNINITAQEAEGNNVKLSISDDGRGMNIQKIKEAALKKGGISKKDIEAMSEEETIKMAFRSDISTSPIITELSGRGLGLGIVSEKVDKLGGHVNVESSPGKGTKFILTLPLTLATFRGVLITVEDQDFIIPTHNVRRAIRINENDIKMAENRATLTLGGYSFSYVKLADILELPKTASSKEIPIFVLLIKTSDHTIAFGVDAIHNEHEILVKSLGRQCVRVKNVMAATVLEGGKVIPILNPIDLVKSSIKGEMAIAKSSQKTDEERVSKKSVLLAEDSLTTRMLLKNILTSAEYDVKTAVDGVEAFEMLQSQTFDLLITDVEMPRMDGFVLTERVRNKASLKEMPIIIVTARGSNEDRERGIELGANAYLDKNSFTQDSFLNIVRRLL